jgi:hypothetical protein
VYNFFTRCLFQVLTVDSRIPVLLQPLIRDYNGLLDRQAPDLVTGFYLVGSIALGGFNPRFSDIDFVAVLSRPATRAEFETLMEIHRAVEQQYPKWKLEGDYFQAVDLGCPDREIGAFLHYHDGKLEWRHQNVLGPVTWWILKNQGIPVFGPAPQAADLVVDMDSLLAGQVENLNSYWASWTRRPGRLAALFSDWGVQWTVLAVLRQFYTLRERRITSKVGAGEYALARLPERWCPIIREAMAMRESPRQSQYRSRIGRAVETYTLLRYVIRICNEDVEAANL